MSKVSIFFTGATGYIGGTILSRLIEHKDSKNFDITILLRPTRSPAGYEALGLKTVSGSDADLSLLRAQAAAADVVFATADCDDLPAAQAILQGAKDRYEKTGKAPVLIHTSGTGELTDNARGLHSTDVVYSDLDIPLFETLPPSQPHRNVDLAVIAADNEGYVKTYIILPPTIYGVPTGILHKHGLQRSLVSQVRVLVEVSIARKQGGVVGEGKNHWPNVDVNEMVDLYLIIFDLSLSPSSAPAEFQHGRSGIYFTVNDEHQLYDVSKAVAVGLARRSIGSPEPTPFSKTEAEPLLYALGTNSRVDFEKSRGKALGWNPTKGTKDLLAFVEYEIDRQLKD
ncbi:NAD(P)-binding protein [Armillaria gallica]|uniref:NAD(P)-binding protein n=1 Tax=Armillaria gallica TaxID=47427 RepID=A0A2H3D912_ARMGA|nr:NAD(P)-binding protein [Armillaria gallica]